MKRLLASCVLAVLGILGFGLGAASADPSITLCHGVNINVAGTQLVDDASCTTAP